MNQDEVVLEVTDLARGGAGVCREPSGRVIFVPFTAPGDRVRVKLVEAEKRYAQAELIEVLAPSPLRQVPRCTVFGKCGGCQWQHLPYSLQWQTKKKGVLHALQRVQIFLLPNQLEEIPAEQIWEYRNRVQLRGEGSQLGFFKPGSRELVPVERCDIARKEINQSWDQLKQEGTGFKKPYKVEVEVLPNGEIRKIWNSRHSAGGFRQVHDEQNEAMRNWIRNQFPSGGVLFDLFGGAGNLCLPLSSKMEVIHCVDLGAPQSAPPGTPDNVHFHRAPVTEWLSNEVTQKKGASFSDLPPAFAILDPPREGLSDSFHEIASALDDLQVKKIVAVGCDADAWARDISRWVKRGWKIEGALLIDLFPQTHHIESVGVLTRKEY